MLLTAAHFVLLHKSGALTRQQVVPGDRTQRCLSLSDLNRHTGLHAPVTVTIRHYQGPAALDQLSKFRIIVLTSRQQDLAAVLGLGVRLTGFKFLQRVTKLVNDKIFRTGQRHQIDNMVFVAGDRGNIQFAEVPYLLHDAAQLIVAFDGPVQRLIRGVHAVAVVQKIQDMRL